MWKEYAVQPECLVQSRDAFRALFFAFGWEQGRLIAQYPTKDWLRLVHEALGRSSLGDATKTWVVDKLQTEKHRLVKGGRPYEPVLSWLENAENQQLTPRPFDGIIAQENPRQHRDVAISEELTDTTPHFLSPGNVHVPRRCTEMAACVRSLLARSREVLFVDPYFGGLEERFLAVFRAMLTHLADPLGHAGRIEYHLAQKSLHLDHAEFYRRLQRQLRCTVPPGVSVKFFIWEERPGGEMLHDRFVLTELGGVDFSVGLDEGEPGQTTKVSRLSRAAYEKVWRDYSVDSSAFDLLHTCTVAHPQS
jgi:hypothetical protein